MLDRFTPYFRPPVFPDDEDKTFTASLLHVILWSLLIGICLYTLLASVLAFIPPHMLLTAWLYVFVLVTLTVTLMVIMRRGYVQRAAISINLGLWLILTVAAYFNGGVAAPAYSGYLIIIICTCLLVSWQWGLAAAIASTLAGAVFLLAATNHWLPDWLPTYSLGSVWGANLAYFFIAAMLLTLALQAIKRAAQKTRLEMAERVKIEQALRNSEQRFRAIFNSVNDAIFVQEISDGRILEVNQKMCEMYGYIVEEARQLTIEDLSSGIAPCRQQDVIDRWHKTAGGEPQVFEWHAKDRAGRLFWVEVNMRQAVIDGQDRLLMVVRDIDERKRAAQREQQIGVGLRAAIEAAQELMDCADLDTLYRRAVELAREKLEVERCGLFALDEQGWLRGTYGTDLQRQTSDERGAHFAPNNPAGLDAASDRLWTISETEHAFWEGDTHQVFGAGWVGATFIRTRDRVMGVLYNDTALTHAPVNEVRQEVLAVYCSLLGSLIELKHAERERQEFELLFRRAISATGAVPYYLDYTTESYRFIGDGIQAMTDVLPGDMQPSLWDGLIVEAHPLGQARDLPHLEAVQAARAGRITEWRCDYRVRRLDGTERWITDASIAVVDEQRQLRGAIGILQDITERKQAEAAVRESEAQLRLITENMVDTISQIDAQYRVLYVSPSIERELGYHPAELLGQLLLDLLHPDDGRIFYHQMIMAASLHAPTLRQVYRQRHAAGHYLWIESEIQLLYDDAGEFSGAVFGSRDVSTRQRAEAEREAVIKELEEKNAELERFTYTVSHDLKSPLITIRGFVGFLEKDAAAGNLDRLRADVGRISDAATRMQRLLDELLNLSRVGRLTNAPQAIAFEALAREAMELVQGRIMARGVQVEIAENLPTVYGDYARLVEVLQNLIDNAVKFMGDQPAPRITIGALGSDREGLPIFFVQDNGVGIAPNYHERVFGLFNKLDAQSEGTGVGLALVKRIIEVHGGHIWVESDGVGHGTMFLFTLPHRPAVSTTEPS